MHYIILILQKILSAVFPVCARMTWFNFWCYPDCFYPHVILVDCSSSYHCSGIFVILYYGSDRALHEAPLHRKILYSGWINKMISLSLDGPESVNCVFFLKIFHYLNRVIFLVKVTPFFDLNTYKYIPELTFFP